MSVIRINDFHAAPRSADALRAFLSGVIDLIKGAPGCRAVELVADQTDASHLVILETWDDIAAHQAAARRVPPEKVAELMPLLSKPVSGQYYDRLTTP